MKKSFNSSIEAGSRKQTHEPRRMSEVLDEFFKSDEPLARAYRDHIFKDMYPHTEPCCQLKLLTREPGRLPVGAYLFGTIVHDRESHFTFEETPLQAAGKRNPRVFNGQFITITRWDDGSYHPNFKAMKMDKGFSSGSYAIGVYFELIEALKSLIEEVSV